jgi:hypothetical protein
LYQTPAAVGGRDENLDYPVPGTWSAKMRKTQTHGLAMNRNDTQEIAKSFWSYFYGGMS